MARTSLALLAGLLLAGLLLAEASMYDRRRGFQAYRVSHEHAEQFAKEQDPHHVLNRHRNKDALKEHPEVKRFLEWKKKFKAGHPDAAVAFAGKIPHDFIPHLSEQHDEDMHHEAGHHHGPHHHHKHDSHNEL